MGSLVCRVFFKRFVFVYFFIDLFYAYICLTIQYYICTLVWIKLLSPVGKKKISCCFGQLVDKPIKSKFQNLDWWFFRKSEITQWCCLREWIHEQAGCENTNTLTQRLSFPTPNILLREINLNLKLLSNNWNLQVPLCV